MESVLETWKPVIGYEGLYEVSDYGCVRSLQRNGYKRIKYLKLGKEKGYFRASLCVGGIIYKKFVHRLVYEAFVGPIPDGLEIDHIDGMPSNNELSNLRVATKKENANNPITRQRYLKKTYEIMANRVASTRKTLGKPVIQLTNEGKFVRFWKCMRDVEREIGIPHGTISKCCNGKDELAGGFKWKFA